MGPSREDLAEFLVVLEQEAAITQLGFHLTTLKGPFKPTRGKMDRTMINPHLKTRVCVTERYRGHSQGKHDVWVSARGKLVDAQMRGGIFSASLSGDLTALRAI